MATPLSSFITKFGEVLVITFRDKDIFCCNVIFHSISRCSSLSMADFHQPYFVFAKKYPLSQASVKCQQTLYASHFLKIRQALTPPKPKLLLITVFSFASRFSSTISKPCAPSSSSVTLMFGAMKSFCIINTE